MYDLYSSFQASSVAPSAPGPRYDGGRVAVSQAIAAFNKLRWRAQLRWAWGKLRGQSRRLLDLDDVRREKSVEGMAEAGCLTVEVAKIRGSECRVCDFDRDFLPLGEANRQRWVSVYAARQCGVTLPAISLVQAGDTYYVRDGHHRVSVARLLGEEYIEAHVQVWQLRGETASAPAMVRQFVAAA